MTLCLVPIAVAHMCARQVSLAVLAPLFDALHWMWQALAATLLVYDLLMRTVFRRAKAGLSNASTSTTSLVALGGAPPPPPQQQQGVPVWAQRFGEGDAHGVLSFLPDEDDDEDDVRRLVGPGVLRGPGAAAAAGGGPQANGGGHGEITAASPLAAGVNGRAEGHGGWLGGGGGGHGSLSSAAAARQQQQWSSAARASTQALGTALASTLLAFALMMALIQCTVQVACGVVVFSRVQLAVPTTATAVVGPSGAPSCVGSGPGPHPWVRRAHPQGGALSACVCVCCVRTGEERPHGHPHPLTSFAAHPVGATIGVENPARLYAGSLCLRWRDEVGVAALIVGAIIWAVQHVVFRNAPVVQAKQAGQGS